MPAPVGALVIAVVHVAAALVGLLVGLGLLRGRATATEATEIIWSQYVHGAGAAGG